MEQGIPLGIWVNTQQYKKRKTTLEQRQVDLLEQACFEWNPRKSDNNKRWNAIFCIVVQLGRLEQGKALGGWVAYQRF